MEGEHRVVLVGERVAVVELTGEHDLDTMEGLHDILQNLAGTTDLLVVDLSEAEFIDSSVLQNLVQAERAAKARGARFRLQLGTAPIVRKVLEVSGLLNYFEILPTREEAIRGFVS